MKRNLILGAILIISSVACKKQKQFASTQFNFEVVDITSGIMTETAKVMLVEVETPPVPFSPLIVTYIDEFEIEYGGTFTGEFQAKRGNRYEYFLEFADDGKSFDSPVIFQGNNYHMNGNCTLSKKKVNVCKLEIEPTLMLNLSANNNLMDADPNDSIWMVFTDGTISGELSFKGLSSSPAYELEVPHGSYTLSYEIYRGGTLDETGERSFYLTHDRDTAITVQF